MTGDTVLACDVGGTRLRVALVSAEGSVHARVEIPTPTGDPNSLARGLRSSLDNADASVAGAVVGMPGSIDYSRGEILKLPNLPNWEGQISADRLSKDLGVPVLLANDADLAALAEHRYGAGLGSRDMVYVTCGTGVGAGVIIGGRLLHGAYSMAEIGHTIIDRDTGGTVESLGSGPALARLARREAADVVAEARDGYAVALAQLGTVASDFGIGVFNLIHIFSPEIVVVGGGMSRAGDLLLDPVRGMLVGCGDTCPGSRARVVLAKGGADVGLKGAAAFWSDYRQG